jgi:hypothetical protein
MGNKLRFITQLFTRRIAKSGRLSLYILAASRETPSLKMLKL